MDRVTLRARLDQLQAIDDAVSDGEFGSRSDAIRTAIDVLFDCSPTDAAPIDRKRPGFPVGALRRLSADELEGRQLQARYERGGVEVEAAGTIVDIQESEHDRRTIILDDGARVAPVEVIDYDLTATTEVA